MRYSEFARDSVEVSVDEGVRDVIAGLALGAGVGLSPGIAAKEIRVQPGDTVHSLARKHGVTASELVRVNSLGQDSKIRIGQQLVVPQSKVKSKPVKPLTGSANEAVLIRVARSEGIVDPIELAAFLAQAQHETHNFRSLEEYGNRQYFQQYDIRGNSEKALRLGNTRPGDGFRYRGRGYLQITGKDNYLRVDQALGLKQALVNNPDLLLDPELAARASVWFWKTRVRPRVDNFADVRAVTRPINPNLNALDQRVAAFDLFRRHFS